MSDGRSWQQMVDEAIAEAKRALEAELGRTLTPAEIAYAEDRGRLKAPDNPASLAGRWAHGATLERLGVEEESGPTRAVPRRALVEYDDGE
jgi:hypothetical protein